MKSLIDCFKTLQRTEPSNLKLRDLHLLILDLEEKYHLGNLSVIEKELIAEVNRDAIKEINRTVYMLSRLTQKRGEHHARNR